MTKKQRFLISSRSGHTMAAAMKHNGRSEEAIERHRERMEIPQSAGIDIMRC